MNRLAEFVYTVATSANRQKTALIVFGIFLWYGGVAIMIGLSPLLDNLFHFNVDISLTIRLVIAAVLFVPGVPMVVWSITQCFRSQGTPVPFKPPPGLMTTGIYGVIRNPMHVGWTLVLYGVAVLMHSFTLLFIFMPLFILVHWLYIKQIEEKELEKKFGQAYLEYKQKVPMWLPGINKRK
ncbi:MAG: isoprenylcysteine carboxylmethyltransferase family protein [Dehalococcoidales bacterium]|nr:isoprenylcysteine carboxylmethyltransferase family protein [Dehalococcoidales bacterium]